MKGYVYIAGRSADPAAAGDLNDPIFSPRPTLGACMPNLRRNLELGDYVYVISGKRSDVQQYLVGGFSVAEKISAALAYERYPEYRLKKQGGVLVGNVVVTADGSKHPLDEHKIDGFERRVQNFIVGKDALFVEGEQEVALARSQTLLALEDVFGKAGNRPIDIIGRNSKIDADQIAKMNEWITRWKAPSDA